MGFLSAGVWERVQAAIASGEHCLLHGPAGTGKTTAAIHESLNGREVYAVTCDEGVLVSELRGTWVIAKGGAMVWQDGPAVIAARKGARLVLNEIDRASEEVKGFLYGLCDSIQTAIFTLPSGEVVRPAAGFQVVATCNGSPDELPEGLRSRFCVRVLVDEVAPGVLQALPEDLRDACAASCGIKGEEQDRATTTRHWLAFAKLRETCGKAIAADLVFGNAAADVMDSLTAAKAPSKRRVRASE